MAKVIGSHCRSWQHSRPLPQSPSAGGPCRMLAVRLQEGSTPGDLAAQAGHYETAQLLGERRRLVALAEGQRAQGAQRSTGTGAGTPSAPPWQGPPDRGSHSAAPTHHGSASSRQAMPSSSESLPTAGLHLPSSGRAPLLADPTGSAVGQADHAPLYPQVFSLGDQVCCRLITTLTSLPHLSGLHLSCRCAAVQWQAVLHLFVSAGCRHIAAWPCQAHLLV